MVGEVRPARFVPGGTLCTGSTDAPHPPVAVASEPGRPFACPLCGQRFLVTESARSIDPAAWPRED